MKHKIIILIILNIFIFSSLHAQKFPHKLIDINGNELPIDSLKQVDVFILSTSFTCDACWKQISFYNKISTEFADKFVFILLIEDLRRYAKTVIDDYKGKDDFYNDKWILIPQSGQNIGRLSQKDILPEFYIFKKGKIVKSFATATSRTERKLYEYLKGL